MIKKYKQFLLESNGVKSDISQEIKDELKSMLSSLGDPVDD